MQLTGLADDDVLEYSIKSGSVDGRADCWEGRAVDVLMIWRPTRAFITRRRKVVSAVQCAR